MANYKVSFDKENATPWNIVTSYAEETALLKIEETSKDIILALKKILPDFFNKERSAKTTLIMDTLALLGQEKEYKVYAHSLSPERQQKNGGEFVNRECLYNLQWYRESGAYLQTSLPLAVE
ncbi:hypothetical protein Barb4_02319 [Bacteroidales bacterium Barb4]|nr:hypothetical protein Barb4_02319 [Bacteroidales bacterium Barb4]